MTTSQGSSPSARSVRAAAAVLLALIVLGSVAVASADAKLTISRFSAGFQTPGGAPITQAGAHGDLVVDFGFAEHPDPLGSGLSVPTENVKNIEVDLPAGFYGNPQGIPYCDLALMGPTQGFCSTESQVGVANVQVGPNPALDWIFGTYRAPVYNAAPKEGIPASFVFSVFGVTVRLDVTARTDGDYGLRSTIHNITTLLPVYGTTLKLWGVPADPVHDADRRTSYFDSVGRPSGGPRRPFLTMPTRCESLTSSIRVSSWQDPSSITSATSTTAPLTGCDALHFNPRIRSQPAVRKADSPSALDVEVTVPQDDHWSGLGTPQLKKTVMTLPEGIAVSPASAQGLEACSDEQLALGTTNEPSCPDASKIGTVSIDTPLLADPLEGDIILGSPKRGQLFRLFLVARGSGLLVKLPGVAQPDSRTGQLTATFDDTPQLPFTTLRLHFKGGDRAPLVTPQSCGTKTATAQLTPYGGGPAVTAVDSFDIEGCTGGFSPRFEAGTLNPAAGGFSPFTLTVRRADGDQEISRIGADLPPGLLGILAGIPVCPEAAAALGACSEATQLGTTTVESGSGDQPLPLTGKVFLAGTYKGQPYSLAIVERAVAGPFDLGTVVIRVPLDIDGSHGKVSVLSDPLPTILEGVPLRLRTINVTLDRPGFMFNATSCSPMVVGGTITSVNGAVARVSSPYHASGCAGLPLNPSLKVGLTGRKEMGKNGHPGVVADLAQSAGQSGLKQVDVPLPAGVSVDTANTALACKYADGQARTCPASSIVGRARVKTPALPGELSGPVYFVEGRRIDPKTGRETATLPRLWLKLEGDGVPLDLYADTAIVGGRVVTTFAGIPDAPIASFHLEVDGGAKGILKTSTAQCLAARTSKTVFAGQNGKVLRRKVRWGADCATRIVKTKATRSGVTLTVQGIGAGRLTVSGSGVRRAAKSVKSADVATITAPLTASAKRTLASTGRVRLRLKVVYTPKSGTAKTLRKTVTIRG